MLAFQSYSDKTTVLRMPVLHFVRFADYFVNCAALVAEPLAIMFQESFQSAILPSDWKSANIVPIFRKGDKTDQNDYRPVSVTPVPCKIMESIIKDSITDNLKPTNQCVKAAAKARSVHGVARRHFKYLDPRDFLIIYKSYVRPNRVLYSGLVTISTKRHLLP